ncbi:aTP-dependent transcriptional regulator-like protein [Firmicutes bacterium CAG:124]|nr:aTP-dependent transcriptional regulator-like protein [Firmicutes bacterium CAG:124]
MRWRASRPSGSFWTTCTCFPAARRRGSSRFFGEAAELVSFLAERLPPQAHLILLSRNQIFSEAQKLRLGSRLLELGAADLRLTQEELLQYAGRCSLPLPEREAQALLSVSEGWIAMIYLMFRAYAQTGVWRFDAKGMDALMEQVMFEPLDERRRFFLLDICMAEAFTAEQAAFVWREPDADALLHDLTHNNAFIIESSPGVYRCHHMLRQLLRRKIAPLPPNAPSTPFCRKARRRTPAGGSAAGTSARGNI